MTKKSTESISVLSSIGLDIGKDVFHLVGFDAVGNLVLRRKIRRLALVSEFEKPPRCIVGMEACLTGPQAEPLPGPLDHRAGHLDFLGDSRRRRLDIDDYRVVHVDQVVEAVTEHHLVAATCRPGGGRIGRRHRLRLLARVDRRVVAIESVQVFSHRTAGPLFVGPIDLRAVDPLEAARVGLDHRGVDGEALAADQAGFHAALDNVLEDPAEYLERKIGLVVFVERAGPSRVISEIFEPGPNGTGQVVWRRG